MDGLLRSGRSIHARPGGGHNGLNGLRLNVSIALEAANARAGQEYQLWVRGPQPRALGKPVQALRSRQHMPRYLALRIIVVHRVHVKDVGSCRDS